MSPGWRKGAVVGRCTAAALALLAAGCFAAASESDHDLCSRSAADPDAGIPACTRLIDRERDSDKLPAFFNNRGVGKVRAGDYRSAIEDFTRALDRQPRLVDALRNRGIAWQMLGEFDRAIADFTQGLRIDRRSTVLLNARGSALFSKEEYERAIADFNAAIAIDANFAKALTNRGLAYLFRRDLTRALADFDTVIKLRPDDPIGYENRAALLMDKGDFEAATADYDNAIKLDPKSARAYSRRGEAWRLRGELEKSMADHDKAVELDGNVEAFNNRALTWKDMGKLDRATADLGEAILVNPKHFLSYANRGDIRRLRGELDGALSDLNRAVQLNPRSPVALNYRGDLHRQMNSPDRALADYTEALRIVPDFVAAYVGRGQAQESKGNTAAAKADFQKALSLSPDADAALARPAQDVARKRLALIAETEALKAKEAAATAEAKAAAEAEAKLAAARAARSAEEARRVAEADARAKAEAEARAKAELEARLKEQIEARLKSEVEARTRQQVEARLQLERESQARAANAAAATAQAEAKRNAAAEARANAEAEARMRAEIEARAKAEFEARVAAEVELRTKAAAEAAQARLAEQAARASGPRIALVIGNSTYRNTAPLANPRNDAADMAAALRRVGFEVIEGYDLDKRGMELNLARFARLVQSADAALVYYAGHGLQYEGQNYLVPVDARLEDDISLQFEMTRLDDVLGALARAPGARLLVLDACRNNPLAEKMAASGRISRASYAQGLARIASVPGLAAVFATQANTVAYDGTGRNSLFTGALVSVIDEPRLEIAQVFRRVATTVNKTTGGRQTPELSLSLTTEFYFNLGETDAQAWQRVRTSSNPSDLQSFITRFPGSRFVPEAKAKLARLEPEPARAEPVRAANAERGIQVGPGATPAEATPAATGGPEPAGSGQAQGDSALIGAIRSELKRLGCLAGTAPETDDAALRTALRRFATAARISEPSGPSVSLLTTLASERRRICTLRR